MAGTYIVTLLALPWNKDSKSVIDMKWLGILEEEHYGPCQSKGKSVGIPGSGGTSHRFKGPILCLVHHRESVKAMQNRGTGNAENS